jgi:hypothetical protein
MMGAFRTLPGNASHAARAAGVDPRTARKAWLHGLKTARDVKYHEPFREILDRERTETRARLAELEEQAAKMTHQAEAQRRQDVQLKAITDLTEERVQETQMVRLARAGTMVLLQNVTTISAGVTALGKKVRSALEARAASAEELTYREAAETVALVGKMATALRQVNDAGQKAMEMTRLLVGEPTSIVGHQHLESVSVGEARERIKAAERALVTLEEAGVQMVDGNTQAIARDVH